MDEEGGKDSGGNKDIFDDAEAMNHLKHRESVALKLAKERYCIRAKKFMWRDSFALNLTKWKQKVVPTFHDLSLFIPYLKKKFL